MADLVKRLRTWDSNESTWELLEEAADHIEKLEKYQSVHAQCDKTSLELEEKLVKQLSEARKRIQMLEAALTHVYAWWPISTFNPHQTIKEIKEFAREALERENENDPS